MSNLEGINIIDTSNIYELLAFLKRRHNFYLTSKSITSLQNFLNGYLLNKVPNNEEEMVFYNYKYWLKEKANDDGDLSFPYSRSLLKICNGDEEKAFDKFFELLDEYREQIQKDSPHAGASL